MSEEQDARNLEGRVYVHSPADFLVEYAPRSPFKQARCRKCSLSIEEGTIRVEPTTLISCGPDFCYRSCPGYSPWLPRYLNPQKTSSSLPQWFHWDCLVESFDEANGCDSQLTIQVDRAPCLYESPPPGLTLNLLERVRFAIRGRFTDSDANIVKCFPTRLQDGGEYEPWSGEGESSLSGEDDNDAELDTEWAWTEEEKAAPGEASKAAPPVAAASTPTASEMLTPMPKPMPMAAPMACETPVPTASEQGSRRRLKRAREFQSEDSSFTKARSASLVGTWWYKDVDGTWSYRVAFSKWYYHFEEEVNGELKTATLSKSGDWFTGNVTGGGEHWGVVRLRLQGEACAHSQFRCNADDAWGDVIVASRECV